MTEKWEDWNKSTDQLTKDWQKIQIKIIKTEKELTNEHPFTNTNDHTFYSSQIVDSQIQKRYATTIAESSKVKQTREMAKDLIFL